MRTVFIISIIFILSSCQSKSVKTTHPESSDIEILDYAKGFTITHFKDFDQVDVINPWKKNTVLARYYLVKSDSVILPNEGIKIRIPINSMVASSATHFGFLEELGSIDKVKAICSPKLIYNVTVQNMWERGLLVDLGDAFSIDTEKSIALNPDLVMISGYKQDDPYAIRLIDAGIPVVLNNEWMEESLLARAEWIKFVGALVGEKELADSVFESVKKEYNQLSELAKNVANKPTVLSGSNFRGTWYLPGGRSYMAKLFKDAGADYYFADDSTAGSIPLQIENVIAKFAKADIWLNCNFSTIEELLVADQKHGFFQPVKAKQVYNFNKRMLPSTANDFWEYSVVHPEILLKDVVKILHPELLPDYDLFFSEKLN